jgi:enterochelin esterase-like enzyme
VLVYLPYGYDQNDQNTRYEMVYLMHGAGSGTEYFLGSPDQPSETKYMLDHLTAEGKIKPSIFVLCDYYPDNHVETAADGDAAYAKNFRQELHADLIPAVETHYHSFAVAVDDQGLKDTRSHRVFGGYGMGAVCTWYRLMDSLDDFAYFLPMSGSFWRGTEVVTNGLNPYYFVTEQLYYPILTSGYKKTEFFVFDTVGSEESWKLECDEQFHMMQAQSDVWSISGEDQNLLYLTVNGAGTDESNPMQVLYTALPFFSEKMPS